MPDWLFDAKFTNLTFLEKVDIKTNCLAFSPQNLAALQAVGTYYQTGVLAFKHLAEMCHQAFLDSAWCIFSNLIWQSIEEQSCSIWQPIMTKIRVETLWKMWKMNILIFFVEQGWQPAARVNI